MFWEELTSPDFAKAVETTGGTCIIPFGAIEKHGDHLPVGTDMIHGRTIAAEAVKLEPAVIFPYYCFAQIAEARNHPGTIAVSPELQYAMLKEVCSEISRNGFKKIIIFVSHGANYNLVNYFVQSSLYEKKDYVVYGIGPSLSEDQKAEINKLIGYEPDEGHGGMVETSMIMAANPGAVKMREYDPEEYTDKGRMDHMDWAVTNKHYRGALTAVWFYASHPNHISGNPAGANAELGRRVNGYMAENLARAIKEIKEDRAVAEIQREFFGE